MRYKLTVAYDGTDFNGWQVQPDVLSIAQAMQDSFKHIFNQKIVLIGASRTDAGVHAMGQTAAFSTDLTIDINKLMTAWNDALQPTIVVRSLEQTSDDFHPIYKVKEKIYWYHFFLERPLPFIGRYGWFYRYAVDREQLQKALAVFVGTHDFRSFCTGTQMGENTVRTIDSIDVTQEQFGAWRITVKGPGFLRHMIRRIVGASLVSASKDNLSADDLKAILKEKDPNQALINAPAKGLCLYSIRYKG